MTPTDEGSDPVKKPKRARRTQQTQAPINLSPSARLDAMTSERIDALEADKNRLQAQVDRLQTRVDMLGPENARLTERLGNAEANNVLATILTTVAGFSVSFATFTGQAATSWAYASAGCLLAGIVMMVFQDVRRRLSR